MIYKIQTGRTMHYVHKDEILAVTPPQNEDRIGSCGPTTCWFIRIICKNGRWFDIENWSSDKVENQSLRNLYNDIRDGLPSIEIIKEININE